MGRSGLGRSRFVSAAYSKLRVVQAPYTDLAPVPPLQRSAERAYSVEGDLQVVEFNTNSGTIETSDGREFSLDASGVTYATQWEKHLSHVHYRCSQGGGCVLQGPGAAMLNARLI